MRTVLAIEKSDLCSIIVARATVITANDRVSMDRSLLTTVHVARQLGLSKRTVLNAVAAG